MIIIIIVVAAAIMYCNYSRSPPAQTASLTGPININDEPYNFK